MSLRIIDLGRRPYRDALSLQRELHSRVARGDEPATWIIVEHQPVVTLGRNARPENVLVSRETLTARGIDLVEVERGGDVTYHGPGQIVVYPIVKLARFREIEPFVRALEEAVIDTLTTFGVAAHGRPEHRGVYVGDNAICAIGLAVKKMTTLHGLALNVSIPLDYDRLIAPCGTPQFGITSLERESGRRVARASILRTLLTALEPRFARDRGVQAA